MQRLIRSPLEVIAVLVGIGGVLLLLYAWHLPPFDSSVETTDNAYVKGYVTIVSPQVSGYVTNVLVKDYQQVSEAQLIVKIDDRIYSQRLDQAKATLESQKAALANSRQQELSARAGITSSEAQIDSANAAAKHAQLSWDRIQNLVSKGISATSDSDTAQATLDQAKAAVNETKAALEVSKQNLATIIVNRKSLEAAVSGAEAAVQLADIDLQHTSITAAKSGRLGEVGVRLGQYVTAGTQLVALVPRDVWVIANFKETQLEGMKIGQPVTFSVDALGHAKLKGQIESFSPAAGSEFAVIRPDNATGNFTKVAQRVGVRVAINPSQALSEQLSPGLSVVVSVDTSSTPGQSLASN
ncbi:multidrug resistance efflux pump [Phyllobacterium sp. 1468]|uniref:HlyD family secretion protein n=1 Tax=Phyllobacterium sp. 1468 TaxID=2817759 RepID=UPI002866BD3C|nr:HlyD family secretion protein [Phyllobacterium sp. 1468]MDR6632632.1 multidrug resistance efflux pump [Phyllobacterium sp. 1468]